MFILSDKILHHNDIASGRFHTTSDDGTYDNHDHDNASIGGNYYTFYVDKILMYYFFYVKVALDFHTAVKVVRKNFPVSSYSSSDDDADFYDADEPNE